MPGAVVIKSRISSHSMSVCTHSPIWQHSRSLRTTKASQPQYQQRRICSKKLIGCRSSFAWKHVAFWSRPRRQSRFSRRESSAWTASVR